MLHSWVFPVFLVDLRKKEEYVWHVLKYEHKKKQIKLSTIVKFGINIF